MFEMTDVIVSFWFLPMTLFIIIPLLMLCGWSVLKLFMLLKGRVNMPNKKVQLENTATQSEASI